MPQCFIFKEVELLNYSQILLVRSSDIPNIVPRLCVYKNDDFGLHLKHTIFSLKCCVCMVEHLVWKQNIPSLQTHFNSITLRKSIRENTHILAHYGFHSHGLIFWWCSEGSRWCGLSLSGRSSVTAPGESCPPLTLKHQAHYRSVLP